MCRVPNSARMLLPAEAQPQLRPTPLEQGQGGWVGGGDNDGWRHGRKRRRAEVGNSTGEKGDFKLPNKLTACRRPASPDRWTQLPPAAYRGWVGVNYISIQHRGFTRPRNRIQERHEFKTTLRTMQSCWLPLSWGQ